MAWLKKLSSLYIGFAFGVIFGAVIATLVSVSILGIPEGECVDAINKILSNK
jgi:hypothetical protein